MSLYPVNDAHLSTSFDSIMRRRIRDHLDTHQADVVILDALPDSNTNSSGRRNSRVRELLRGTIQGKEKRVVRRGDTEILKDKKLQSFSRG
ncbi:hypothetical protein Syun_008737 [Stephania yunnanensis]|uniref:Uncharacterized protein n=1 Tax=Stephania yunnanensis TaxID=152371 RepID=A0AAP0PMV0_9MAGN